MSPPLANLCRSTDQQDKGLHALLALACRGMEKATTKMLIQGTSKSMQQATALDHCMANIALHCHVMVLTPCLGLRIFCENCI